MGALLDCSGFDRRSHHVAPDCWYYEERSGLSVYFEPKDRPPQLVGIIQWRSLEAAIRRYRKGKK